MTIQFNPTELSLEQQFQMTQMKRAAMEMSREQAMDLLLQASKLLMIKDNLIKDLKKQSQ